MRRAVILITSLFLATFLALPHVLIVAQSTAEQTYQSDVLGLTFQYPGDWQINEQLSTHTVMAASAVDLSAIKAGRAPSGLIFTVTVSSFRLLNIHSFDDFAARLQSIAGTTSTQPVAIKIGSAQGLALEIVDAKRDVGSRTALISIGERQLAVVRGISTASSWKDASAQLDQLLGSLSFNLPTHNALDSYGQVLWQTPVETLKDITGIAASPDGSSVYLTDRTQGIMKVSTSGIAGTIAKPDGIAVFGELGILDNGTQIVAGPSEHSLWQIAADTGKADTLVMGKAGTGAGEFGDQSPQSFAFGLDNILYVLDQTASGPRIEVFNRVGKWVATWNLSTIQTATIQNPLISSDDSGNVYLLGSNTNGAIILNPAGKVSAQNIGKADLTNVTPLALAVDRAENMYIATADDAVLKLNAKGQLTGIIGEPFDEAGPPKPGQLGKPTALTLADDDRLLYVADSGKHPQIVAFGLNGNYTLNVVAGTKDQGKINFGQTVSGEITTTTFVNTYSFDAKANDVITITMQPSGGSQLDPYVELDGLTAKGNVLRLASNDDANTPGLGPTDAQIKSYHVRYDATYTIHATRFGGETTRSTGGYQLTLALERPGGAGTPTIAPTTRPLPSATNAGPVVGPTATPTQAAIRNSADATTGSQP